MPIGANKPGTLMSEYTIPKSLENALDQLASGDWTIVVGGTDVYPSVAGKPLNLAIMDISKIGGLRGIRKDRGCWRIGGLTTWTDIVRADLPPAFEGLKQAARQIGSIQIQNAATVAGNLCNASPAADGVPPLLTLDAEVELTSLSGVRTLALADFITGNRRTARAPGELLSAIFVPADTDSATGRFLKLGVRDYQVISIVSVAALMGADGDGRVKTARVAVGACSEVPCRLVALEDDLIGRPMDATLAEGVRSEHLSALAPIDDVRASAGYRLEAAVELLRRTLAACVRDAP